MRDAIHIPRVERFWVDKVVKQKFILESVSVQGESLNVQLFKEKTIVHKDFG